MKHILTALLLIAAIAGCKEKKEDKPPPKIIVIAGNDTVKQNSQNTIFFPSYYVYKPSYNKETNTITFIGIRMLKDSAVNIRNNQMDSVIVAPDVMHPNSN